jgi:hypothetical protein
MIVPVQCDNMRETTSENGKLTPIAAFHVVEGGAGLTHDRHDFEEDLIAVLHMVVQILKDASLEGAMRA